MKIETFSKKQSEILQFAFSEKECLICDGAVRSGKTVVMILSFVIWAMSNFENTKFGICAKTVGNAEKNIILPLQQIEGLPFSTDYKISRRVLVVKCGKKENYFYVYGGKDERSYALIQGATLAGVLFDEVALMPRSFVDQAIARTLSFKNAKLWFNCNPESPNHWFYKDWILRHDSSQTYLHFLMTDNPILGEDEIKRAGKLYQGVFYDRYILGKWVRAEGIVFRDFADDSKKYHIERKNVPEKFRWVEVGFDVGGNGSAYALTCAAQGFDNVIYVLRSQKKQAPDLPMANVEQFVFDFIDEIEREYKTTIRDVNCDHSDVIINTLNERRYIFGKTYKPPLSDRPYMFSRLMAKGAFKLVEGKCSDLEDELKNLIYDDKNEKPVVLDDGSMQIDTWDSLTYSVAGNWHYLD